MAKSPREFRISIYEQFARIGKALSSATRLELLDLLCQGPRTVEVLGKEAGQSLANTSHHLQVLRSAHLVEKEKDGVFVTYRLADDDVREFFRLLRNLAESRLAEVAQITREFLAGRDALEPVDREALLRRVRTGNVTVLDVRPAEEYSAGHIAGAVSIPLLELEQRLVEVPAERDVVAYCRGPYCVLAIEAVRLLEQHGFAATRLEDGVADWRARGFEVAIGEDPR